MRVSPDYGKTKDIMFSTYILPKTISAKGCKFLGIDHMLSVRIFSISLLGKEKLLCPGKYLGIRECACGLTGC